MSIYEKGYKRWEGELTGKPAWWIIAKTGIRLVLKRKLFLILFLLSLVPFLARGVMIYLVVQLNFNMIRIDARFFREFLSQQGFWVLLMTILGGAGLIAADIKSNALKLYLSRPIGRWDYILGKTATLMLILSSVTILPSLLLFLERGVLSNNLDFLRRRYWLMPSCIGYGFLISLAPCMLMLALSALTGETKYAAISFGAIVLLSSALFEVMRIGFRNRYLILLSFWDNIDQIGALLFGIRPRYRVHWIWSLFILLGLIAFSLWALSRKVRAVEVSD
ncbi:ABC-2 transporter permease [Candidatus Poribacteria bacterium]|nr:ABC-2 transporter permease [Candidatus Poribacteria bacterium]